MNELNNIEVGFFYPYILKVQSKVSVEFYR